jgi:short subunit dehydrogenase-like uncharacterized protein
MADRDFDIVLYGATGFVGRQAAQYLAPRAASSGLRWAVAGRDRARLESVRELAGGAAGVIVADSADAPAVEAMAHRTRLLLNTAGPFALFGDAVVDACVRAKTNYVDITGETVWVRSLIDRHHEHAARDGTRIIPCCGFDSVPSDLGSFLVARHMKRTLGVDCREIKAYFRMFGGFNGGTIASNMNRHASGHVERGRDPFLLDPEGAHPPAEVARDRDPAGVHFDADIGAWVGPFVMGPMNTRVVRRSAALFARWGESYGDGFHYQEYTRFGPPLAHAKAAFVTALMAGFDRAMAGAPSRALMSRVLPKPGEGPSRKTMDRGWFECMLLGTAQDGRRVRGAMRHEGDPGNRATVRFVCESALALALDGSRLPGGVARGGLLTPATGLGDVLASRLRESGMAIEIGA